MCTTQFAYLFVVDGNWGCFQFVAIKTKAATNIPVQGFVQTPAFIFLFLFFFGETYTFISGVIPLTDCKIKARGPRSVQGKIYKGAPSPLITRIWKQI